MDLLEKLVNTHGVPGRESGIRGVIEHYVKEASIFDELRVDPLGTLVGVRKPRPKPGAGSKKPMRVLLAAHMDQIGFLVSYISDKGHLSLHPVGAFDSRTLFARPVVVTTQSGEQLPGVMNPEGHPIHTAKAEDTKKVPELKAFYVDLGLPTEDVKAKVRKGDMVVPEGRLQRVGHYAVASGLDNRAGCWALIRAMEKLVHHDCEIYCAFTAQEELGSRGAGPVTFDIAPDLGISCDTVVCCEVPGVEERDHITSAGDGVALQVADSSTLSDMKLVADVETIARSKSISCQRSLMLGGGQDGALIQRSRGGVPTIVFGCPLKHMHTVTEMVHMDDLSSYRDLLCSYLE